MSDDREPIDTMGPWTIKSVSTATRETVTKAAKREGVTVGQWLERRVAEWEADGSPMGAAPTATAVPVNLGDLARAMDAARVLASEAQVTVPKQMAREGLRMVRAAIRQANGARPAPAKVPALAAPNGE